MEFKYVVSSDDREAWLQARRRGVTATEIAELATGGPAAWEKLRIDKAGHGKPFAGNQYTEWGRAREPLIAAQMAAKYPWLEHNSMLVSHAGDERYLATPDMIGWSPNQLCQIKTRTIRNGKFTEPPRKYRIQCLWELFVTGAGSNILAVEYYRDVHGGGFTEAFPFDHPQEFLIERDDDEIAGLVDIADQFLAGPQPSIFDLYLADYVAGDRLEKSGKAEKAAARELIVKEAESRPAFVRHVSEGLGTVSKSEDRTETVEVFDVATFKSDHPDLYAQYLVKREKEVKGRITITPAKENHGEV